MIYLHIFISQSVLQKTNFYFNTARATLNRVSDVVYHYSSACRKMDEMFCRNINYFVKTQYLRGVIVAKFVCLLFVAFFVRL